VVNEATVGTRQTRQRAEVLALLDSTDEFRSAMQLFTQLRSTGASVGLTTVYRTLQLLADAGEVDQMRVPGGEQMYRRCMEARHHHHLVCRACGRAVEVQGPAVEAWTAKLAATYGFTDVAHTLEVFGTCAECAKPRRPSRSRPTSAERS
jgi:Fur family ferric uptake transcriptional regulator